MVEAPDWFVWTFDFLLFAIIFLGLLFLMAWRNVRNTKGKMIAEIWEPNGFATRELVKPDPTGATVTVENLVYRLPKELGEKELAKLKENNPGGENSEVHTYPRRRWVLYPARSFLGLSFLQTPLRIESWERDNPEPIRPFYGRFTEDGKFDDSQLTVTSTEWQAQKSVIQATGIAMSVQDREAREKEWQKAMANLPNKMIVYLGLGIGALASMICVILVYQLAAG